MNNRFVRCIRRSDERIVGNVEPFPKGLELRRQLVAMGLRVDAGFGRSLLNFLPMFIEPGEKEDVASTQAPVTSKDIGSHGRLGMSDVWHIVDVVDWRCDVEAVGGTHLGACPALTFLLRRTMSRHLLCSRPQKILNVFQRIRLRFFGACGRASACPSFAS
ncbi:MAG: hypothetical protein JW395_0425 [Nitrospira sp.]|nr:hypothetical protein [Nitrospira sp.]